MELLERIHRCEGKLTKAESAIATWLQDHLEDLAFKPAIHIATQCGVSEATVTRFARKLGYDSYPNMQAAVQVTVQQQLSLRQKLQQSAASGVTDRLPGRVFQADMNNLRNTMRMLDGGDFQRAVERLVKARRVGVLGLRASAGVANFLRFLLNLVRPDVQLIGHVTSEGFDHMIDYGPDDAVVIISVVKPAPEALQTARYCALRRIPVVSITDWQDTVISSLTDPCLRVDVSGAIVESYTSVVSLCNALFLGVAHALPASAEHRLQQLEEAHGNTVAIVDKETIDRKN